MIKETFGGSAFVKLNTRSPKGMLHACPSVRKGPNLTDVVVYDFDSIRVKDACIAEWEANPPPTSDFFLLSAMIQNYEGTLKLLILLLLRTKLCVFVQVRGRV